MSDDKYESHIKAVLSECPEANTDEIRAAFVKYEEEFYIPPQDALRSIIRRFQGDKTPTSSNNSGSQTRQTKKVASLSELSGTDRDIEIEVEVVSHNLREQTIRGESALLDCEKQPQLRFQYLYLFRIVQIMKQLSWFV